MSAEWRTGHDSRLEIDATVTLQTSEIRPVQRFLKKIECQLGPVDQRYGKATSIHRNAVARTRSAGQRRRRDLKLSALIFRPESDDRAHFFDEAGEHFPRIARATREASAGDRSRKNRGETTAKTGISTGRANFRTKPRKPRGLQPGLFDHCLREQVRPIERSKVAAP